MLAPLLLGYVVGAVGIYALLYKISPVVAEDRVAQFNAPDGTTHVEVIELFPTEQSSEQTKAA